MKRSVSVIVPLFNEETTMPLLAAKLSELNRELSSSFETEYVLVDDGSSDGTRQLIATTLAGLPRVVTAAHPRNLGSSSAFIMSASKVRAM